MLDHEGRRRLCERLTAATMDVVAGCGPSLEVQLFGFGVRLVPPDGAALLAWFLVPGRDELFVSVHQAELAWDVDPVAGDAVDQVVALLRAGVLGGIVHRSGPRAQTLTACLDDGRTLVASRSRSRFRRPLLSRMVPSVQTFVPYPADAGTPLVRDVTEPPALLAAISSDLALEVESAGYRLTRSFDAAGIHGLPSDRGGVVFGWGTQVTRPDEVIAARIWFDGVDRDLAVVVEDSCWFEWRDLDDRDAVHAEAVEVVRAALDGRLVRGPRRTASVQLPNGRLVSTEPPPPALP